MEILRFLPVTLVALLVFPLAVESGAAAPPAKGEYFVYFGTYTRNASKGIYVSRLDAATGKLTSPVLAAETVNPSFLALRPDGKFLYAVGEIAEFQGKKSGAVSAFAIDPKTGKLTFLDKVSSRGAGPCHVSVDKTGRCAMVANYGSGSVAAMPIKADGSLAEAAAFIQHTGSSVNPQRQKGPHAHCIIPSPDNRFAIAADLGLDKVFVYQLDPAKASLTLNNPPFVEVHPGAGPRHFAFHPNGRFGYVINEIQSTVTAFSYDAARGALRETQTISTIPENFKEENSTAEVEVHPNGKFLYGSNRGHDSIAVFAIDPAKGTLTLIERASTRGKTPRCFGIDPTGSWLLAANQDTDNVVAFRIDQKTGKLTPTGQEVKVGAPVCVKFLAIR